MWLLAAAPGAGAGYTRTVKWAILLVLVILTAPTTLGRFEHNAKPVRRGILFRSVRRYGRVRVITALMRGAAGLLTLMLLAPHW
jgi:hypothetical protein